MSQSRSCCALVWAFASLALLITLIPSQASARSVNIGVIRDGEGSSVDLVPQIEAELRILAEADHTIRFMERPAFVGEWTAQSAADALEAALGSSDIDVILATGVLTTQAAADANRGLSKPVVSSVLQFMDLYDIPYDPEGGSLKENLSFCLASRSVEQAIREFVEISQFEVAYIAVDESLLAHLDRAEAIIEQRVAEYGIDFGVWAVGQDLDASLATLPENAGAVLLSTLPRLSSAQRAELVTRLKDLKQPAYSLTGYTDVEQGALAAGSPDYTPSLVRRVALNLAGIVRGRSTDELPVTLALDRRLLINGRTAAALGMVLPGSVMAFAKVLHPDALQPEGSPLSLEGAMRMAQETNVSLAIQSAETEGSRQDANRARGSLLPRVDLGAQYDRNGPESRNLTPWERKFTGGVAVSQMLYDDKSISDYRSSKEVYEGQEDELENVRQRSMARGGSAYLRFVLATILYRIEASNVRLTEDNLELAQVRYETGYSGRDEVFRWKAELAQRRSDLLAAENRVETERLTLNQILGVNQTRRWHPQEIEVDPDLFPMLEGGLDTVYSRASQWQRFKEFAVSFALEQSPQVQSVDRFAEASRIQLGQRKRRYFLPQVFADFRYSHDFYRDIDPGGIDKNAYFFGLSARYNLFEGLGKSADVGRLKADVLSLEYQSRLFSDLVERRVRTATEALQSSFPSIRFKNDAAFNSRRNLEVVQERYAQGAVNITDLLEAQNASFQAEQNAAAGVYQFLLDLVEFQRSISWFEFEQTPESRAAFIDRARAYITAPPEAASDE
jgi:outer membrane protein TolC